jgi:hypothetical protein
MKDEIEAKQDEAEKEIQERKERRYKVWLYKFLQHGGKSVRVWTLTADDLIGYADGVPGIPTLTSEKLYDLARSIENYFENWAPHYIHEAIELWIEEQESEHDKAD